jgi:hypothetical protein
VAQTTVYSLNIVGYVNVPVQGGGKLTLISNPLKPSNGNNNITNTMVLPDQADGTLLFTWGGTAWNATTPSWLAGFGWDTPTDIPPGNAFFVSTPATTTNFNITFVGEVATGTIPYTYAQGLNMVANKVPVTENFPGASVGNDGDLIYTWNGSAWNSAVWGYIGGFGWNAGGATDSTNGPLLAVGSGVAYSATAPLNWTRTFNP